MAKASSDFESSWRGLLAGLACRDDSRRRRRRDRPRKGYRGFDPDAIFGLGSPLVPQVPPRRVAVDRCSCGEPGCGCAACLITQKGDIARWSDFRDYTGVYERPLVEQNPSEGTRQPVSDLDFDAAQYHDAVRRASEDRGWETRRRRRARLLRGELLTMTSRFDALGYSIGWVGSSSP